MATKGAVDDAGFDLAALIREMTEKYGPDPTDIAVKVEPQIPESERSWVLRKTLAHYIRGQKMRPPQAAYGGAVPFRQTRSGRLNKSAKVAMLQRHAKLLRATIRGVEEFKFLGKCDFEDLMFAAETRRKLAHDTLAAADNFEWLAHQLHEYDVKLVEQLPPDVLEEYAAMLRAERAA